MSYYGVGTEEAILNDLYVQISSITGINFVDYQRIQASGISPDMYPGCFINAVRTDKKRLLKDIVRNNLAVALVGWVWATDDEDLLTKLNTFINSVRAKVIADPYRNSNALNTAIRSITTDGGSRHPQGQFVTILEIVYFGAD